MRLKLALIMRDSVFTVSVLAVPGTPSISAWPSANSATSICSMGSSWPTIILASSRRMWLTVEETYSGIMLVFGFWFLAFGLWSWSLVFGLGLWSLVRVLVL